MKELLSVTEEEAGAVIGKHGKSIEVIREMSRARITISKKGENDKNRVIKLEGEEKRVAFAKHLIKLKISAHRESLAEISDEEDSGVDPDVIAAANVLAKIGNI